MSSKPTRNKSPAEKKFRSKKKTFDDETELPVPFKDTFKTLKPHEKNASTTAAPSTPSTPVSTPKEEVKPFIPDKVEEPPVPVAAAKGKSYRANRLAKQKKPDGEKADQDKPVAGADTQKESEPKISFDDANIPPLTASKHVITLDNDQ